ncbi:MAG TPA: enolase C-terminal domain-like protein [Gaiellaceae bacterium]|nr:enolase C-terminal domain-like protein [Gaiellaceae bacterium]
MSATVDRLETSCFTIPTDAPESDGTAAWNSTTIVVVEAIGGGRRGVGWTYAPEAAAKVVADQLAGTVAGRRADEVAALWLELGAALRNAGRPGIARCALSAVDLALWDLHARLLGLPLVELLAPVHDRVPVYGSGGFCSYSDAQLAEQLGGWAAQGIPRVKMKLGREPERDPHRLDVAREAIGGAELYVDANGAFTAKEAVRWAKRYVEDWDVRWFEEPVSSADFAGLRFVRERSLLDVAAGEYAYVPADFRNLLGAVDCLQLDVTRCGGITGALRVNGLSIAHEVDLSGHCAPQLSAHALCAVDRLRHLEYFHDHVRIESMLFDGVLEPDGGALVPDRSRPGNGLELKHADARRWAA